MKEALYEAVMQDAERYEDPARRAEASEEDELARFFREIRDENRRRTEKARRLLRRGVCSPGGWPPGAMKAVRDWTVRG